MKNHGTYPHDLWKVALFSMVALIFPSPSVAQKDLQILVNEPWSYVRDQANYPNRFLLVGV